MIGAEPSVFARLDAARPAVKICGIMQPEHARAAASYGANMIGLVFAPSKRRLSVEVAHRIRESLDSVPDRPLAVGIFVNETPERMCDIASQVGLDILQLSGDEDPSQVAECARSFPVIKGLRFRDG